jgi:hypothetical protein
LDFLRWRGAATLTIFVSNPFVHWGYEVGIFLLAGCYSAREYLRPSALTITIPALAVATISLWGFAQLAIGAAVYRYATWEASCGRWPSGRRLG